MQSNFWGTKRTSERSGWFHAMVVAPLLMLMLIVPGCGGGTSGTGVQSFSGKVLSDTSAPLSGVVVTIEATGAQGITDATGTFLIESAVVDGDPLIRVAGAGFDTVAIVPGVPAGAQQIAVTIQVNIARNEAEAREVRVTNRSSSSSSSRSSSSRSSSRDDDGQGDDEDDDSSSSDSSSSESSEDDDSSSSVSSDDEDDDSSASQSSEDSESSSSSSSEDDDSSEDRSEGSSSSDNDDDDDDSSSSSRSSGRR